MKYQFQSPEYPQAANRRQVEAPGRVSPQGGAPLSRRLRINRRPSEDAGTRSLLKPCTDQLLPLLLVFCCCRFFCCCGRCCCCCCRFCCCWCWCCVCPRGVEQHLVIITLLFQLQFKSNSDLLIIILFCSPFHPSSSSSSSSSTFSPWIFMHI